MRAPTIKKTFAMPNHSANNPPSEGPISVPETIAVANVPTTAKRGKILREGLKTAIIGRPNVGKSSY